MSPRKKEGSTAKHRHAHACTPTPTEACQESHLNSPGGKHCQPTQSCVPEAMTRREECTFHRTLKCAGGNVVVKYLKQQSWWYGSLWVSQFPNLSTYFLLSSTSTCCLPLSNGLRIWMTSCEILMESQKQEMMINVWGGVWRLCAEKQSTLVSVNTEVRRQASLPAISLPSHICV